MRNAHRDRFWRFVHKDGEDGCWLWMGALSGQGGYGAFVGLNERYAHRYSYRVHVGPVPAGHYVCHSCDNPRCVRPSHLFLGTPKDNHDDMKRKGRSPKGETHGLNKHPEARVHGERQGRAKLTWAAVQVIRQRYAVGGVRQADLAKEFGVCRESVSQLVRGVTWKPEFAPAHLLPQDLERAVGLIDEVVRDA